MPPTRLALSTVLLPALAACGGDATAGSLATRADSAGIEIVTNTDPSWRPGDGWQIDPVPTLEIGPRPDDDPRYDFLRIGGGSILPSGEVVVLVASSREIRVFRADGEWDRTIGRDGEGPGEMRGVGSMIRSGDTLFVPDAQLGRLNAYRADGEFLTSWRYLAAEDLGRLMPTYRLADGSWIAMGAISFGGDGMPAEGLMRLPMRYYRLSADLTTLLDTIVATPGSEMVLTSSGSSGSGDRMARMIFFAPPPLGRSSPVTGGGSGFLWGDNAVAEVRRHEPDGTLSGILRWNAPHIPVDAALIERIKQATLEQAPATEAARDRIEAQFANPSPTPVVPFFSALHLDEDGALWVQEYPPAPTDSLHFQIFHPDGQYLGRRSLPPRHRVLEIGREHLLTVWQDDDDLEHIRMYRIVR